MHRLACFSILLSLGILGTAALTGCNEGHTNTSGADLRAFGLESHISSLDDDESNDPQPRANFPATIAIVRVQGQGYHHRGRHAYAAGGYTIVTTRDVETDDRFKSFASHPMIRALVPLNHLALPSVISARTTFAKPRGA